MKGRRGGAGFSPSALRPIWVESPPDRTGFAIDILPPAFGTRISPCVLCGGDLDVGWECNRCGADHFPAVKKLMVLRNE